MFSSVFIPLAFATSVLGVDFGCDDYSYNLCHDPPATQELHVGNLEECIQNCDLFASFDQCDYLMYYGDNGPDENCKIISGPDAPEVEMNKYLSACGVIGQGITIDGIFNHTCVAMPELVPKCTQVNCPDCQNCSSPNAKTCSGYRETQCLIKDTPGETSPGQLPNYDACFQFCHLNMKSSPWNYLAYNQESQECICYELTKGYECDIQVVRQGMSFADVTQCHV